MIEYQQTKKTESGDFIVSHSDLCKLDPTIGGHPKLFYKSLTDIEEKKYNPSFEKGDLLHLWMQKRNDFIIEDQDKPTDKPAELAKEFHKLYIKEGWKSDPIFLELRTHNTVVGIDESLKYKELFKVINRREGTNDELALFIAAARFARKMAEYDKRLLEPTFIEHLKKVVPYIQFLSEANGKVILTAVNRDILTNCVESIKEHPFASKLSWGMEGNTEKEYFWQRMYNGNVLYRKGKLDKEIVDPFNKRLVVVDYKTTSFPISSFVAPEGSYNRYKLGRQLTNYADGFFANHLDFNSGEWDIMLFNVVVQTIEPYPTMVFKTPIYNFKDDLKDIEERAMYHISNNQWRITMEEAHNENSEYITIGPLHSYNLI